MNKASKGANSKNLLKIFGIVILVVIVGLSAYNSTPESSLEQTDQAGRVYQGSPIAQDAPCTPGSSFDNNSNCVIVANDCEIFTGVAGTNENGLCCNLTSPNSSNDYVVDGECDLSEGEANLTNDSSQSIKNDSQSSSFISKIFASFRKN